MEDTVPVDWASPRLAALAATVPSEVLSRRANEAFKELLKELYLGTRRTPIALGLFRSLVGEPDRVGDTWHGKAWYYEWTDYYGPIQYLSATPFLVRENDVIGYWRDLREDLPLPEL